MLYLIDSTQLIPKNKGKRANLATSALFSLIEQWHIRFEVVTLEILSYESKFPISSLRLLSCFSRSSPSSFANYVKKIGNVGIVSLDISVAYNICAKF